MDLMEHIGDLRGKDVHFQKGPLSVQEFLHYDLHRGHIWPHERCADSVFLMLDWFKIDFLCYRGLVREYSCWRMAPYNFYFSIS